MKRILPFIALAAVSVLSIFSCQQEPAEIRVSSISLSKSALELTVGDQASLDATISPDNATNKEITWKSDNEAVATVSAEGVLKALRAGTASITATTVDQGRSASCTVTVTPNRGALTGEATHISCRNAKLSGKANLPQNTSTNLSFGVLYSTSSGVLLGSATKLEAKDFDANYNYTIDTGVLEPETTYYYRSYIIQNEEVEYGETKSFKTLALSSMIQTLDASGVNPKDATLNAMLDLTDCKYNNIEYGFELIPEGGQANTLTADNLADKAFSYRDETLIKNTKYSYSAYVILDGILYKAVPKTFTTASIQASLTAEASDIQCKSATISGSLTVQSEGSFSKSAVLYYSNTENTVEGLKSNGTSKTLTLGEDGSYSAELSSLSSSTSYNYVVVAKVDDVELVTEVKSFKTLQHPYELTYDLDVSSAIDLSSSASANCYIISEAGLYKFETVKGNSTTSVGSVAFASILWETFGTDTAPEPSDLISGFCYKDGYIAFQTADTFKEGNAVIAAKDADGNILWSWHIWLTDQPQSHVYNNNAGTMMDRNLGATSATPGDVGALGLLYQWGRKDPFLGSSRIGGSTLAKSTITWPSAVSSDSSNGTIEYATANPTTYITYNNKNYDWYYTGDSSTDNTRWTTSSSDKSIYDPCPAGWRVPDGGSNGIWSKAGFDDTTSDWTNRGMSFSISSPSTTWYPASGYRYDGGGGLSDVGNYGYYWSASPGSYYAYGLYFEYDGCVDPSYGIYRSCGYSVRCLQE